MKSILIFFPYDRVTISINYYSLIVNKIMKMTQKTCLWRDLFSNYPFFFSRGSVCMDKKKWDVNEYICRALHKILTWYQVIHEFYGWNFKLFVIFHKVGLLIELLKSLFSALLVFMIVISSRIQNYVLIAAY